MNYWHSAEFTWDGLYVVTDDESFTGTCDPSGDGKIRIWRVSDGHLMSSFMIPRPQGSIYCSVHNGNIIPIAGRYILVAAWYGGGTSVVDFTDPSAPTEIGYYVATTGRRADTWSSYWYNGKIYANDIARGQDVFNLDITGDIQTWGHLNPQTQEDLSHAPLSVLTARAARSERSRRLAPRRPDGPRPARGIWNRYCSRTRLALAIPREIRYAAVTHFVKSSHSGRL